MASLEVLLDRGAGSQLGVILPLPREHLVMSETPRLGGGCYSNQWVEARDVAKCPTCIGKAPQQRMIWSQMSIALIVRTPALDSGAKPRWVGRGGSRKK